MVNANSDKEICQLLKDNEIDIAVDLKGHTYKTRIEILSSRPSPGDFSGSSWNYCADYIDYVIGDNFVLNQSNEKYFSEKALKLTHCYQPNDNKKYLPKKFLLKEILDYLKIILYFVHLIAHTKYNQQCLGFDGNTTGK